MLIHQGFQQPVPIQPGHYTGDAGLRALLKRVLPRHAFAEVDHEFEGFQDRLAGPIHDAALLTDAQDPSLVQYDQWGRRVDVLATSEGWRRLKEIGAEEGMVSIFFERKYAEFSRLVGFAKTYLWVPESRYVGCPLSMTDGCARVLELYGTPEMKAEVLPRLLSKDPKKAWTSGQWMTERPGGSDVSLTETVARPANPDKAPQAGDNYILDGFKWFSSATDGNVSLALARTSPGKGSQGLSLFLVNLRDAQGGPNGIYIHRLKRKYGTKAVPTAELVLENTLGQLVGTEGQGVSAISTVLNITRLHSSISSVSSLRRALVLASSFARVRTIGGSHNAHLLSDNEMHTSALFRAHVVQSALLQLTFEAIRLLGVAEVKGDQGMEEGEKWRLRLLTPVVKSFCADWSVREMPSLMESCGGQGYMVENEFGRLIADASVEKIWEGTTSVLSLDVVRVIQKSKGTAVAHLIEWGAAILARCTAVTLKSTLKFLTDAFALLKKISQLYSQTAAQSMAVDPRIARPHLFLLGYLTSSLCLLEQALWSQSVQDEHVLVEWVTMGEFEICVKNLKGLLEQDAKSGSEERAKEKLAVYGSEASQRSPHKL